MDSESTRYARGQKQYSLTFVQVGLRVHELDRVVEFSDEPAGMILYEGVFFSRTQAESYLTAHSHSVRHDNALHHHHKSRRHVAIVLLPASDASLENGSAADRVSLSSHCELTEPATQHGDAASVDAVISADSRQLVVACIERKLASLQLEVDPFLVQHQMLLLTLMNTDQTDSGSDQLLLELYSVAHSQPARLHVLMKLNRTLRELLFRLTELDDQARDNAMPMMNSLLDAFRDGTVSFFRHSLQSQSSRDAAWSSSVLSQITQLSTICDSCSDSTFIPLIEMVKLLKNLYSYKFTVYLMMLDAIFGCCPCIKNTISSVKQQYADEAKQEIPQETFKFRIKGQSKTSYESGLQTSSFKHGYEDSNVLQHNTAVISVKLCSSESTSCLSATDLRKSVLTKYVTDSRLDEVWRDFIYELVALMPLTLPPTPTQLCNCYQRLLTIFRQSAAKMELCHISDEQLTSRVRNSFDHLQPISPDCAVYRLQPYQIYGVRNVLELVDGEVLGDLLEQIAPLFHLDHVSRHGAYTLSIISLHSSVTTKTWLGSVYNTHSQAEQVEVCCAMTGRAVLYGHIDPYLDGLKLYEHCYITGPAEHSIAVIQLYAKIVYRHLVRLYDSNQYVIEGVYFGENQTPWLIADVVHMKKGFIAELQHQMLARAPVSVRMYMAYDWRAVPVEKFLVLHYIEDDTSQLSTFGQDEAFASWYHSLFIDSDKARFHLKHVMQSTDYNHLRREYTELNQQLVECKEEADWLAVFRLLLWKEQLQQDASSVHAVSAAWRMLHSSVRRVDHVMGLVTTLQDIVRHLTMQQDAVTTERKHPPFQLETVMSRILMAVKEKVVNVCQQGSDNSLRSVVDAVLAKLDTVSSTDVNNDTQVLVVGVNLKTILMLDEVIHMLAAVRDAAAADTYAALLPSDSSADDNVPSTQVSTPQQRSPATDQLQQQQGRKEKKHRRTLPRPVSVASIDLRDPGET